MILIKDSDNGVRGDPTKCHYCGHAQPDHTPQCIVPRRAIVVKVTFLAVVGECVAWDKRQIEFHLNDSSTCADNVMGFLGDSG